MVIITASLAVWQQGDDARLRHSLQIEVALSDVLSTLQDAEIGQRGYLLTNDPAFLEPFRRANERVAGQFALLGQSVAGQPEQARLFTELRALAAEAQRVQVDTLAAYDRDDIQGALDLVRARTGKALMDDLRRCVEQMDAEEDRLVEQRQSRLRTIRLLSVGATIGLTGLMAGLAQAALREARRRASLARFLPSEIAPYLADNATELATGSSQTVAVAFVDLRGSTALAEKLSPAAFMRMLTEFRHNITQAARRSSGVIDKFIGDGALIVFGLTGEPEAAAANALRFAEDLLTRMHAAPHTENNVAELPRFGIGVHFGKVFCGVLGDEDRLEFTVLGDTVNVAARLEAHTKDLGVQLVVSEAVLCAAGQPLEFWHRIADDTLPGRDGPVGMYAREVLDQF
jgi:adenylate cyclase